MSMSTMIVITALQLSGVAVMPTVVLIDSAQCPLVLQQVMKGMAQSFAANATGPHKDVQMIQEGDWHLLKTPVWGREIARASCGPLSKSMNTSRVK